MNIVLIPAKGNSTRIPRKNMRPFLGRPIIDYSIWTAFMSGLFEEVWVSTNDIQIAAHVRTQGAEVIMRPARLRLAEEDGAPDCGTQEVTRHAIINILQTHYGKEIEFVCCLYPAAPLITYRDLSQGMNALKRVPPPYFAHPVGPDGKDAGGFYIGHAQSFIERLPLKDSAYVYLPAERAVDINTFEEWTKAEELYAEGREAWLAQQVADGVS